MRDMRAAGFAAVLSVLLLTGAGCGSGARQEPTTETRTQCDAQRPCNGDWTCVDGYCVSANDSKDANDDGAEIDAVVDAYLGASAEEQADMTEEDADASEVTSTDSEVNAYGQAYDANEL